MVERIEIIASNGNEGTHYKVEKVARIIAIDERARYRHTPYNPDKWKTYIPLAIKIVEELERETV
jgi:hypothetical protein